MTRCGIGTHESKQVGLLKRVAELANTELPAEEILLKWFNYHLSKSGSNRKVGNFSSDLQVGTSELVQAYV